MRTSRPHGRTTENRRADVRRAPSSGRSVSSSRTLVPGNSSGTLPSRHTSKSRSSSLAPNKVQKPKSSKKTKLIIVLGVTLPVIACIIGIAAWAVTTDVLRINPRNRGGSFINFGSREETRIADGLQPRSDLGLDVFTLSEAGDSFQAPSKEVKPKRMVEMPTQQNTPVEPSKDSSPITDDSAGNKSLKSPEDILKRLIANAGVKKKAAEFVVFAPVVDRPSAASNKDTTDSDKTERQMKGRVLIDNDSDLVAEESVNSEELSQETAFPFGGIKNHRLKSPSDRMKNVDNDQVLSRNYFKKHLKAELDPISASPGVPILHTLDARGSTFLPVNVDLNRNANPLSIETINEKTLFSQPNSKKMNFPENLQTDFNQGHRLQIGKPLQGFVNSQHNAPLSQSLNPSSFQQSQPMQFQNPQTNSKNFPIPKPGSIGLQGSSSNSHTPSLKVPVQNRHQKFQAPLQQFQSPEKPYQDFQQGHQMGSFQPPNHAVPLHQQGFKNSQPSSYQSPQQQSFISQPSYEGQHNIFQGPQTYVASSQSDPQYFAPPPQTFHTKTTYNNNSPGQQSLFETIAQSSVNSDANAEMHHHHHHHHHRDHNLNDGHSDHNLNTGHTTNDADRLGTISLGGGAPRGITLQIGGGGGRSALAGLLPIGALGVARGILSSLLPRPSLGLKSKVFLGVEVGRGGGLSVGLG